MKVIYDERNIIFSRVRLKKDSKAYQSYYANHPELKEKDDQLRDQFIKEKLRVSDAFKARFFPLSNANQSIIKSFYETLEATPLGNRVDVGEHFHDNIKAIAKHYGAVSTGIVKLKDDHYYKHHGGLSKALGLDNYGEEVRKTYTHAIVYAVEMDHDLLERAPFYDAMIETENAYLKMAFTGFRLAIYLKQLGYKSIFQSEDYYLTPLVPLAYDAGIGEIGMTNHIIHKTYGNRIRLGAVLTTLKLKEDEKVDFGLEAFCKRCGLCVMTCPSKSIYPSKRVRNDRPFYKFDDQSCYKMWLNSGTDCGVCIKNCPFSQMIDEATIDKIKNNNDQIDAFLKDYLNAHPLHTINKTPHPIIKEEKV
jgi:ferredoxin